VSACSTRLRRSAAATPVSRKPNSMLSATVSQEKQASSWNTTPMPSGMSPAIGLPSNSIVPELARVRPASTSSRVDLPQPDGPTTAKNSPRRRSMSIGPRAFSSLPSGRGKTLVTSRRVTWAVTLPLFDDGLDVVGQEARVDDLVPIDLALDGADHALHLDHALHPFEMDLTGAPVGDTVGSAGGQVAHCHAGDRRLDVVVRGDDVA